MATLVAGQLIGLMLPLSTPKKKFKLLENKVTGQITKYNQLGRTGRNGLKSPGFRTRACVLGHAKHGDLSASLQHCHDKVHLSLLLSVE